MTVTMRFTCVPDEPEVKQVEVVAASADERLTTYQLRQFVSSIKERLVPPATLRTWRYRIGISPDQDGLYTLEDLSLLARYLEAQAEGRTTAQFLNQEYGHAEQRPA